MNTACPAAPLRIVDIIEAEVSRPPGGNDHAIGPDRLSVGEKQRDRDVCVLVPRVEDARCLVRHQCRVVKRAVPGNVAIGDRPRLFPMSPTVRCSELWGRLIRFSIDGNN